jgi:hypothetical protein
MQRTSTFSCNRNFVHFLSSGAPCITYLSWTAVDRWNYPGYDSSLENW